MTFAGSITYGRKNNRAKIRLLSHNDQRNVSSQGGGGDSGRKIPKNQSSAIFGQKRNPILSDGVKNIED
jgi:hypothetical protein